MLVAALAFPAGAGATITFGADLSGAAGGGGAGPTCKKAKKGAVTAKKHKKCKKH